MEHLSLQHGKTPVIMRIGGDRELFDLSMATAQTLLKLISDASDVFPPLKTVASALQFFSERVEVNLAFCCSLFKDSSTQENRGEQETSRETCQTHPKGVI